MEVSDMETEIIVTTKSELLLMIQECIGIEIRKNNNPNNTDDVLTSEEVLKLLRISKSHLITLRRNSQIPFYVIGNSAIRYRRSEIMDWLFKKNMK